MNDNNIHQEIDHLNDLKTDLEQLADSIQDDIRSNRYQDYQPEMVFQLRKAMDHISELSDSLWAYLNCKE